ncbi:MAG: hypothetical protein H6555_10075 [Lewinellaceae bacterium]|nr:hypothetical protein [Lewinellaceae bacterium]
MPIPAVYIYCQEADIPRDTSFTIYSNYQKLRKKYPFVTPITPNQPRRVKAYPDLVYRRISTGNCILISSFRKNGSGKVILA